MKKIVMILMVVAMVAATPVFADDDGLDVNMVLDQAFYTEDGEVKSDINESAIQFNLEKGGVTAYADLEFTLASGDTTDDSFNLADFYVKADLPTVFGLEESDLCADVKVGYYQPGSNASAGGLSGYEPAYGGYGELSGDDLTIGLGVGYTDLMKVTVYTRPVWEDGSDETNKARGFDNQLLVVANGASGIFTYDAHYAKQGEDNVNNTVGGSFVVDLESMVGLGLKVGAGLTSYLDDDTKDQKIGFNAKLDLGDLVIGLGTAYLNYDEKDMSAGLNVNYTLSDQVNLWAVGQVDHLIDTDAEDSNTVDYELGASLAPADSCVTFYSGIVSGDASYNGITSTAKDEVAFFLRTRIKL